MTQSLLDKAYIITLKNDEKEFERFLANSTLRNILFVLMKFGRLENAKSKKNLLSLLHNRHENVRKLAISNLAKLKDLTLLDVFFQTALNDTSTIVRREAVSAMGRLRSEKSIAYLVELLSDADPKVTMQAIRGLLAFKNQPRVQEKLKALEDHPNEMIQELIKKELYQAQQNHSQKHSQFPAYLKNKIIHGDALRILKIVEDEAIHLTFTSPPYYNARDYSIYKSYEQYLRFLENVFREVHRITKEGRFFILNTSPIIIPRVSRAHASKRYPIPYDIHPRLTAMGWEFIDDIVWVKPEASVKNRTAGFLQHRKPLAYKPNCLTEMLMVYRKKTHRLIDWNIKQYPQELVEKSKVQGDYDTSNVWRIDPCFDKVHSAVFPQKLCERVIRYYSFIGDLVFDPFAGSGTLGKAARDLGRHFFMTEKKEDYCKWMKEYIKDDIFCAFSSVREFEKEAKL